MIRELADYEWALHEVQATEDQLHAGLFGPSPTASCTIAEFYGQVVGFALWFLHFSTWLGGPGVYLEDLYVRPEARGRGAGAALLRELARICVERGVSTAGVVGAGLERRRPRVLRLPRGELLTEWVRYRLSGPALEALAR